MITIFKLTVKIILTTCLVSTFAISNTETEINIKEELEALYKKNYGKSLTKDELLEYAKFKGMKKPEGINPSIIIHVQDKLSKIENFNRFAEAKAKNKIIRDKMRAEHTNSSGMSLEMEKRLAEAKAKNKRIGDKMRAEQRESIEKEKAKRNAKYKNEDTTASTFFGLIILLFAVLLGILRFRDILIRDKR